MSGKPEIKRKREPDVHHGDDEDEIDHDEVVIKSGQKRGRPRVENRDANAIERRRTQIRVAQRAYRARKDSAISDLQARVAELHKVVRDATVNLQEISDKVAIEHDIRKSTIREDLHLTIIKLLALEKTFDVGKADSTSDGSPPQSSISGLPSRQDINAGLDLDAGSASQEYQLGFAGQTGSDRDSDNSIRPATACVAYDMSSIAWVDPFSTSTMASDTITPTALQTLQQIQLPLQVSAMPTFSWQETTFARRLLRHGHETCLRHIENPSDRYGDMMKRVRYSLAFMDQDALIQKLKYSVSRSTRESLEDWSMPMLHIGGAGTHFGADTTLDVNPDHRSAFDRNVGPFQVPTAAIPVPESMFPYRVAEFLGLEGPYLDPTDVEAYLRRKGLRLEGAASTTIYEIQISPQNQHSGSTTLWVNSASWSDSGTGQSLDFMNFFDTTTPGGSANLSESTRRALTSGTVDVRVTKVLLSVDQLVEKLNEKAVCLGRATGYKQSDVDEAFDGVLARAKELVVV